MPGIIFRGTPGGSAPSWAQPGGSGPPVGGGLGPGPGLPPGRTSFNPGASLPPDMFMRGMAPPGAGMSQFSDADMQAFGGAFSRGAFGAMHPLLFTPGLSPFPQVPGYLPNVGPFRASPTRGQPGPLEFGMLPGTGLAPGFSLSGRPYSPLNFQMYEGTPPQFQNYGRHQGAMVPFTGRSTLPVPYSGTDTALGVLNRIAAELGTIAKIDSDILAVERTMRPMGGAGPGMSMMPPSAIAPAPPFHTAANTILPPGAGPTYGPPGILSPLAVGVPLGTPLAGGGGGGGRGGGGGVGAGGYHGGGFFPAMGRFALGRMGIPGMMMGAGMSAGTLAAIGEVAAPIMAVYGAYKAAIGVGNAMEEFAQPAQYYNQFHTGSALLGRRFGFDGGDLRSQIYSGPYQTSPLRYLGLTAPQMLGIMRGYGISGAGADPLGPTRAIAEGRFMPGIGDLNIMPTITSAGAYGFGRVGNAASEADSTYAGVSDQVARLGAIMYDAQLKALNQSQVLRSIDQGIRVQMRGGGFGVNPEQTGQFLMRFSDMPGGRTGEMGLSAMQGMAAAAGTVGSNAMRTMVWARAAAKINSEADLKKALGADRYATMMQSPVGRRQIANWWAAKRRGDSVFAAADLHTLTGDVPDVIQNVINLGSPEFLSGLAQDQRDVAKSYLSGTTVTQQQTMDAYPNYMFNGRVFDTLLGQTGGSGYDSSKESAYREGLKRQGVRADLIDDMLANGKAKNINPLLMGAIMRQESTGGTDIHTGAWGVPADTNVLQVTSGTGRSLGYMRPPANAHEGVQMGFAVMAEKLRAAGGDVSKAVSSYGPASDLGYGNRIFSNIALGTGLDPRSQEILGMQSDIDSMKLGSSDVASHVMVTLLPAAAAGLDKLSKTTEHLADVMVDFANKLEIHARHFGESPVH